LEESEQLDNTVIVVTSDHGDMLGERGLWYKMNFFEHSARVPLVIAGPNVKHGVSNEPVSLVDLYPTFLEVAGAKNNLAPGFTADLDGRSLTPLLMGSTEEFNGRVIAEYCAECASHPMLMIREGDFKYIHCDADPAQLYNVEEDPRELVNLATHPDHKERADHFEHLATSHWNSEQVRQDVIHTH